MEKFSLKPSHLCVLSGAFFNNSVERYNLIKLTLHMVLSLGLIGCTTYVHNEGRNSYLTVLDEHSRGDKQFSGFYEHFELRATLLSPKMLKRIHQRKKQIYGWSSEESFKQLEKEVKKFENQTAFWMSFYTPSHQDDNLSASRTIWKIYLLAGGKRYEGRAEKVHKNLNETKELFPYHNRWTTGYYLKFPVAYSEIAHETLTLALTGPLGRRDMVFSSFSPIGKVG